MEIMFAVRLKKNGYLVKYFQTFEEALENARARKEEHPYVEIDFVCIEVDNCTLTDGYMSKTVWTAQDDVEA